MTDEQLAAIRARCEKLPSFHVVVTDITVTLRNAEGTPLALGARSLFEPVADFLVHARTDVPALLDEIERLRMDLGLFRSENDDLRVENERLRKVCQQFFALFPPGSPDAKARGCICQPLDREQSLPAYMHTRYHNCPLHGSAAHTKEERT